MNLPYYKRKEPLWQRPKTIALIIAVVFILWILSGVIFPTSTDKYKTPPVADSSKPINIRDLPIRVKVIDAQIRPSFVSLNGVAEPARITLVEAETEGKVIKIAFEEGAVVKKGETLIKLDVRDRQNKLSEAKALLAQRKVEYNASKKLYAKGFHSKVRLSQAEAALASARSLLKRATLDLSYTSIRAPYTGVIEEILVENGDLVGKGFSNHTVLRFVDMSPLKIIGRISENERSKVAKGDSANLRFSTGEELTGKISFVASVADKETRTFKVEVEVPNSDRKLQAGVSVEISLQTGEQLAYEVSSSVLSLDDSGRVGVKVLDADNIVRFKPVTVSSQSNNGVWVTGLSKQINLIIDGASFVSDGQEIGSDKLYQDNKSK